MNRKILVLLALFIVPQLLAAQIMQVHTKDGSIGQFDIADIDSITFGSSVGQMTWLGHASIKITTNEGVVIGFKLYHSGDTSKIDEMAELAALSLDYALLCIDGIYNMGPEEAMQVAEIIQAEKVIPIHVAPSNASEADKQKNIAKFNPPNKLILKEGDTIYL